MIAILHIPLYEVENRINIVCHIDWGTYLIQGENGHSKPTLARLRVYKLLC